MNAKWIGDRTIELEFSAPVAIPGESYSIEIENLKLVLNYKDDEATGRVQKAIVLDNVILPMIVELLTKATVKTTGKSKEKIAQ